MEVKLTESGLNLFGFGPDRIITNVNLDRAYALMAGDYANKDKNFMALYEANHPKPEPKIIVWRPNPDFGPPVKAKTMKKLKPKPKKEKAISKKAAKREKAVKP